MQDKVEGTLTVNQGEYAEIRGEECPFRDGTAHSYLWHRRRRAREDLRKLQERIDDLNADVLNTRESSERVRRTIDSLSAALDILGPCPD